MTTRGRGKSQRSIDLINAAIDILEEIKPASVRAVAYQLFNQHLLTSMAKSETNRLSVQLTWAREQGNIPWSWITDDSRAPERVSAWEDPEAYVETVKRAYRRDRWADQPEWVEVWSEKATIRGTLAPVLNEYGITFRVMHGYGSTTALHQVAEETHDDRRILTALYIGDWDPSGLHMSEVDLPGRLDEYDGCVDLVRLALTSMDTLGGRDLPSFSVETKRRDPRYRWFRDHYGRRCWELDAMSPVKLRERVRSAIDRRIDHQAWERADVAERAERDSLTSILKAWPSISRQASKCSDSAPGTGQRGHP